MYGSLSSMVIMSFPLISKMHVYKFPLLSIIVILFYLLFGIICLISGRFYLLGLPWPLGYYMSLTKPILFLCCHKDLHIVICLDDILVLVHCKWAGKRANSVFVFLVGPSWVYISIFPSLTFGSLRPFTFLGLCWDTVYMSVSLPPDKLADIQQLALSLLWTTHATVHRVMSFLGKAIFCTIGQSQLHHLCHVIQCDMLTVYHSPMQLFSHVHFSLSYLTSTGMSWLIYNKVPFLCNFHFQMWSLLLMPHPLIGPFIFQGSGLPLSVSGAWSGSLCRAYIALQELHAVASHAV